MLMRKNVYLQSNTTIHQLIVYFVSCIFGLSPASATARTHPSHSSNSSGPHHHSAHSHHSHFTPTHLHRHHQHKSAAARGCSGVGSHAVKHTKTGKATFYHDKFNGRKTANGERFSQEGLTAASNYYPCDTVLMVTNMKNGASIPVRVNDTGELRGVLLDLSKHAIELICDVPHKKGRGCPSGRINVMVEVKKLPNDDVSDNSDNSELTNKINAESIAFLNQNTNMSDSDTVASLLQDKAPELGNSDQELINRMLGIINEQHSEPSNDLLNFDKQVTVGDILFGHIEVTQTDIDSDDLDISSQEADQEQPGDHHNELIEVSTAETENLKAL